MAGALQHQKCAEEQAAKTITDTCAILPSYLSIYPGVCKAEVLQQVIFWKCIRRQTKQTNKTKGILPKY